MSDNDEDAIESTSRKFADRSLSQSTAVPNQPACNSKATVIGLYGVPGVGKTALAERLKNELGQEHFAFYEGSEVIAGLVPGGLDLFKKRGEQAKLSLRQQAITEVGRQCAQSGKVGIVTGHFMFWDENQEVGTPVYTQNDLYTFTHILYLEVPARTIIERRREDNGRSDRQSSSEDHLHRWQEAEKNQLSRLCRRHGLLFFSIPHPMSMPKILDLIKDFRHHSEATNLSRAESMLDGLIAAQQGRLGTMVLVDGDRTLAAVDTGTQFWKRISNREDLLKELFSSPLGYSYTAFRQAMLLYEEAVNDQRFEGLCEEIASEVPVHPEFVHLVQIIAEQAHVGVAVITCGLRRVWEKVLERIGMSDMVKVIGGGRIANGFVVTPEVKGAMIDRLRSIHGAYVWAFGDSPLDLSMLRRADRAIVVVGELADRSKTMDQGLRKAIDDDGLEACQLLLPTTAPLRLDSTKLPVIQVEEITSLLSGRLEVFHATDKKAAKLLMTPTRDATVAGKELRAAHHRMGWYLATELVADVVGLEEYSIQHVQTQRISGHRLLDEKHTAIVALMRGGEPMAFGVNAAFPLARFIHAHEPADIKLDDHLQGLSTVMLIDSVINSGKTIVDFVHHIRRLHATVRIIVVAGVVQAESLLDDGHLVKGLAGHGHVSLVALRLSGNKYTGKGGTDTGNRLFNTTHLS